MKVKTIIEANPTFKKEISKKETFIEIAEFFYNTIQGEGINTGHPSAFLRVQHCTLNCVFCDTTEVWRSGKPYTLSEIFELIDQTDLVDRLKNRQHLVLTGGSPLKQQNRLIKFIGEFILRYGFKPYIEIENECTLPPHPKMKEYTDCWSNSPKLSNSSNIDTLRYRPPILKELAALPNSWFKFVVTNNEDWDEIKRDFLDKELISWGQVILMPMGADRKELYENREYVADMAVENNVKYCSREQVILWDIKTGV